MANLIFIFMVVLDICLNGRTAGWNYRTHKTRWPVGGTFDQVLQVKIISLAQMDYDPSALPFSLYIPTDVSVNNIIELRSWFYFFLKIRHNYTFVGLLKRNIFQKSIYHSSALKSNPIRTRVRPCIIVLIGPSARALSELLSKRWNIPKYGGDSIGSDSETGPRHDCNRRNEYCFRVERRPATEAKAGDVGGLVGGFKSEGGSKNGENTNEIRAGLRRSARYNNNNS